MINQLADSKGFIKKELLNVNIKGGHIHDIAFLPGKNKLITSRVKDDMQHIAVYEVSYTYSGLTHVGRWLGKYFCTIL